MFADSKISNWFASPLGQWLLQNEQRQCETLLPAGYYPYSLQLGLPIIDLAENIETGYRVTLSNGYLKQVGAGRQNQAQPTAVARAAALPFGDRSHNLIFLPHTLDFCSDPHAVLREVSQVLAPEGYAVIIGFNRLSLWGGMRWLSGIGALPMSGCYRVRRVQDWLALLGFDLAGAGMLAYKPPIQSDKWRQKLAFMEQAGARWWPGFGAVYVVIGRKRERIAGGQVGRLRWPQLIPAVLRSVHQPAAKSKLAAREICPE